MTAGAKTGNHEILARAQHVFGQLFSQADGYVISLQVEETRVAMPVFVALHVLASLAVFNLAWGQVPTQTLLAWGGLSILWGALLTAGFVLMRFKQGNVRAARLAPPLGRDWKCGWFRLALPLVHLLLNSSPCGEHASEA